MTTKKLYLVNDLQMPLTFKKGDLVLKAGGFKPIIEKELEEPTIMWAIDKGWAHVTEVHPVTSEITLPELDTAIPLSFKGFTFEELQEVNKAKAESEQANDGKITSTALGQNPTPPTTFTSEQIGVKKSKTKETAKTE